MNNAQWHETWKKINVGQHEERQIEEIAKSIEKTEQIARDAHCGLPSPSMYAKDLYWKGCRKVVFCKDCVYNKNGGCMHSKEYDEQNYNPEYFCADGLREEDNE